MTCHGFDELLLALLLLRLELSAGLVDFFHEVRLALLRFLQLTFALLFQSLSCAPFLVQVGFHHLLLRRNEHVLSPLLYTSNVLLMVFFYPLPVLQRLRFVFIHLLEGQIQLPDQLATLLAHVFEVLLYRLCLFVSLCLPGLHGLYELLMLFCSLLIHLLLDFLMPFRALLDPDQLQSLCVDGSVDLGLRLVAEFSEFLFGVLRPLRAP
mmetsp:Transcript_2045/g.4637  ORF Transcript_2045/g.4637 Transcript_2045/m.4637 type:complete len:209 (-) Transcript_2045:481-1107(-)